MAQPLDPTRIDFLVPLLLVIVERLATLTRSIAKKPEDYPGSTPVFVPFVGNDEENPTQEGSYLLPRLGRLNFLHTTNVSLLTAAFLLLAAARQDIITNVLGVVVAIVWIQLPLIEIDVYDEIRDGVEWPKSLYAHFAGSVLIMAYVAGFGGFEPGLYLRNADLFAPDVGFVLANLDQTAANLVLLGLVLGSSGAFLHLFEQEARKVAGNEGESDSIRPRIGKPSS